MVEPIRAGSEAQFVSLVVSDPLSRSAASSVADKCRNCGKTKGDHQAETLLCPRGKKTRIGYIEYGPTAFAPEPRVLERVT